MGLFSRDVHTLDDLFVHTLRDIYYTENRIVKALPDMIEKASEPQLKQAFNSHLGETENHISRLQEVFRMYDVEVKGVDCPAIDGILEEVDDLVGEDDQPVLDAALIAAAQVVEHYQIARYGSLIAWAKELGRSDCASVLEENFEEEKAASRKLTLMADPGVDIAAAAI
jgi:ferritin-like metal-binding protein YciE